MQEEKFTSKAGFGHKIIVIVSGGMDSVTLLHWLQAVQINAKKTTLEPGFICDILALSFNYGQRHKKELSYAKKNCDLLGIAHQVVDLTAITPLISNSALTGKTAIPEGHYADESMKITVVPNRNMIMLSIAVGVAENLGFDAVAIGAHKGDHPIYPDCRESFILCLSNASQLGTYNKVRIISPFINLNKTEIAMLGLKMKLDYDKLTWSCYKGGLFPCGKCGTCVERKEALEYARRRIKG